MLYWNARLLIKPLCLIASLTLLSACGGGGGGTSSSNNGGGQVGSDEIVRGNFQVFTIEGLAYESRSASGDLLRGITNESGEFEYREGDIITFSIGDLNLISLPATELISILGDINTLLPRTEDGLLQATARPTLTADLDLAINLLGLLLTLDQDGDIDTQINLVGVSSALLDAPTINLELPMAQFLDQAFVQALRLRHQSIAEFDHLDVIIFLYETLGLEIETKRIDVIRTYLVETSIDESTNEEVTVETPDFVESFLYNSRISGDVIQIQRKAAPIQDEFAIDTFDETESFVYNGDRITDRSIVDADDISLLEETWAYVDSRDRLTAYTFVSGNINFSQNFDYQDATTSDCTSVDGTTNDINATVTLTEFLNGAERTLVSAFDCDSLLETQTETSGEQETVNTRQFFNNGENIELVHANGNIQTQLFSNGRLDEIVIEDAVSNEVDLATETYAYDPTQPNQLIQTVLTNSFTTLTRNFSYDENGIIEQCLSSEFDGLVVTCSYDTEGRVLSEVVDNNLNGLPEHQIDFTYNEDGFIETKTILDYQSNDLSEPLITRYRLDYDTTTLTVRGARYLLKPPHLNAPGSPLREIADSDPLTDIGSETAAE